MRWRIGHDDLEDKMKNISLLVDTDLQLAKEKSKASLQNLIQNYAPIKSFLNAWNLDVLQDNCVDFLVHKSFANEASFKIENNERLEFLGDSVLQLMVSQRLYREFNDLPEGELSKVRSAIVNEKTLATLGRMLKLQELILVGKGEVKNAGFEKDSIISDTFEALLGSLYLNAGLSATEEFFSSVVNSFEAKGTILFSPGILDEFDAKSRLQEKVMKLYKVLPEYRVEEVKDGFKIDLMIDGKEILSQSGHSKKKLMQQMASETLKNNLYMR
jgi:ribonuclease-3